VQGDTVPLFAPFQKARAGFLYRWKLNSQDGAVQNKTPQGRVKCYLRKYAFSNLNFYCSSNKHITPMKLIKLESYAFMNLRDENILVYNAECDLAK
jgi:hypothetical protein